MPDFTTRDGRAYFQNLICFPKLLYQNGGTMSCHSWHSCVVMVVGKLACWDAIMQVDFFIGIWGYPARGPINRRWARSIGTYGGSDSEILHYVQDDNKV